MSVLTLEGVVENGQIRLRSAVRLPDNTKVFVIAPDVQVERTTHIFSPRLAHPEDAVDFQMEIVEVLADAGLR